MSQGFPRCFGMTETQRTRITSIWPSLHQPSLSLAVTATCFLLTKVETSSGSRC